MKTIKTCCVLMLALAACSRPPPLPLSARGSNPGGSRAPCQGQTAAPKLPAPAAVPASPVADQPDVIVVTLTNPLAANGRPKPLRSRSPTWSRLCPGWI